MSFAMSHLNTFIVECQHEGRTNISCEIIVSRNDCIKLMKYMTGPYLVTTNRQCWRLVREAIAGTSQVPSSLMKSVSNCSILPKNDCRYRQIREDEGNGFFSNADCLRWLYFVTRCQHASSTVYWQSVDHRIRLWCCHISIIQFLTPGHPSVTIIINLYGVNLELAADKYCVWQH